MQGIDFDATTIFIQTKTIKQQESAAITRPKDKCWNFISLLAHCPFPLKSDAMLSNFGYERLAQSEKRKRRKERDEQLNNIEKNSFVRTQCIDFLKQFHSDECFSLFSRSFRMCVVRVCVSVRLNARIESNRSNLFFLIFHIAFIDKERLYRFILIKFNRFGYFVARCMQPCGV